MALLTTLIYIFTKVKGIKLIKRLFISLFAVVLIGLIGATLYTYFYKDKVIDRFVTEINKNLNAKVAVGKFDLSIFDSFPKVSIVLDNVVINDAIKGSTKELARAKKIKFSFSTWQLIKGNYVIDDVSLEQAEVWLRINKYGKSNYLLVKRKKEASKEVKFNLDKISLKKVLLHYSNFPKDQSHDFFTEQMEASMEIAGSDYMFDLKGDLLSKQIRVGKAVYFKDKNFDLDGELLYDNKRQRLSIISSQLFLEESAFEVDGFYSFYKKDSMKIDIASKKTNVKTLLSLVPKGLADKMNGYESKGEVYFQGSIYGELYEGVYPATSIEFGFKDASVYHPDFKKALDHLTLSGNLKMGSVLKIETGELFIDKFRCELDGETLNGSLKFVDFVEQNLDMSLKGLVKINSFFEFYPIEEFSNSEGSFDFDVDIKGKLRDLEQGKFLTAGEIMLQGVGFDYSSYNLPFRGFNGTFLFNNSDLAITDFTGSIGSSDFQLNGMFRNILNTIFSDKQGINIEADLKSNVLNLDELLSGNTQVSENSTDYSFRLSPNLQLDFDCSIDQLTFRRFNGKSISGHLDLEDQIANLQNIRTTSIGGSVLLNAQIDASEEDKIKVESDSKYDGLEIDSIFYVFENFNQSFLEDRHLKGQVVADVDARMQFDNKLNLNMESLTSEVKISIKNGELNGFEPMQRLSKFVEEESLAHLRFSDLQNTILIEDQVIHLPQMEVKSNVSNILIKGTHTFAQEIDYYLKVPLTRIDKIDKDEAFGAVEDDGTGVPNLFLTIRGTTSNYKIAYDKKAVGKKLKEDFKKEGQELKEVFKNKGKVEETVELEEDEYFDFEEDSIN